MNLTLNRFWLRRIDPRAALQQSVANLDNIGVFYTRQQLYYEVSLCLSPPALVAAVSRLVAVTGVTLACTVRQLPPVWTGIANAAALIGAPPLVGWLPFTITPPLSYDAFNEVLAAFSVRYGQPRRLLTDEPSSPAVRVPREPDLYDYGMPFAIVCQDAAIARMLRANGLHMELECAILSLTEATPLPDSVLGMLMLAPAPCVFLLHDASIAGLGVVANARTLLNVPTEISVRSLGLRPRDALHQHLFAIRQVKNDRWIPTALAELDFIERRWLSAGYTTQVAALRPLKLLRTLRRAVSTQLRYSSSWLTRVRQWHTTGYMTWPDQ